MFLFSSRDTARFSEEGGDLALAGQVKRFPEPQSLTGRRKTQRRRGVGFRSLPMRLASAVCEALLCGEVFDPLSGGIEGVARARGEALSRRWKILVCAYLAASRRWRAICHQRWREALVVCRWSRIVQYLEYQQDLTAALEPV